MAQDPKPEKDAPKAEEPKAETPKAEEPKADAPKAETPKAEEPKKDAPKAEEPKAEEPEKDAPKAEEPKKDAPKAEEPKPEEAKKDAPKAEEPKKDAPKAAAKPSSDRPEGVDPESVKQTYTTQAGDSFVIVAAKLGFLPDELASWNSGAKLEGDKLAPGQKLTYWAALLAEETPPEEDKGKDKDKTPKEDRDGVSPFVGLSIGPTIAFSPLKAHAYPRLEAGVELPPLDRMFRVFVSFAWTRPAADGKATAADDIDRTGDGGWTYDLKQDEFQIAFGPTVRLPMLDLPIIPEASIGPDIYILSSVINGKAGDAAFPESKERYVQTGLYFAVGAALEAGPGEATLNLQLSGAGLKEKATPDFPDRTTVTGKSSTTAFAPSLGYRLVF